VRAKHALGTCHLVNDHKLEVAEEIGPIRVGAAEIPVWSISGLGQDEAAILADVLNGGF